MQGTINIFFKSSAGVLREPPELPRLWEGAILLTLDHTIYFILLLFFGGVGGGGGWGKAGKREEKFFF